MLTKTIRTIALCAAAASTGAAFAQEATPRTPSGPTSTKHMAAFRQADTNGDSRLSFEEASKVRGITRLVFDSLDTDKNGSLDSNEFAMSSAVMRQDRKANSTK